MSNTDEDITLKLVCGGLWQPQSRLGAADSMLEDSTQGAADAAANARLLQEQCGGQLREVNSPQAGVQVASRTW